jgi:type I restriction enzyme S subunit
MSQIKSLRTGIKFKDTPIGKIPVDWEATTLENVCDILDGKRVPLNKEQRDKMKGNIPYYGANGIVDYINDYIFDEDLILLAEDGGYFDEYQTRPIAYLIHGKSWVNNHAHVLKVMGHTITEWIFYSLVHKNVMPFIKGGTRSKLNQADLRQIPMPLPPFPEQKKIGEILTTVDDAIEKTDRIIEKTKELKKGLMQKLLTRGIGHKKFKKTEIGEIPVEWEVVRLKEIANVRYGLGQPPALDDNGIPMVRATNIHEGAISKTGLISVKRDTLPLSRNPFLKNGDIIVVRSGAYTGDIGLITQEWEGAVAGYDLVVTPASRINSMFLTNYLLSNIIQKWYFASLKERSAQPHLNSLQVEETPIALPPITEQEKISEVLSSTNSEMKQEEAQKKYLETLKKSLMQVLLTGRVRVKLH